MGFIYINNKQQFNRFIHGLQQCKDFLTVGWRIDSGYWMFDDYISKIFDMRTSKLAVLDAFEPNLRDFNKYDVIKIPKNIKYFHPKDYDMKDVAIIWEHGPEHVQKDEAIDIIKNMQTYAKFIAVETPRGSYPQGALYGNPYEQHISEWDFLDYFNNFPDFDIWYNHCPFDRHPGDKSNGVLGAFWSKP